MHGSHRQGGHRLSADENARDLEGDWISIRDVLAAFPGQDIALAWNEYAQYQTPGSFCHLGRPPAKLQGAKELPLMASVAP